MTPSWIVVLPSLVVLISSFISRKLVPSIILGIITASLIASNLNPLGAINLTFMRFVQTISDSDTLFMYGFLLCIGAIVALLTCTGGNTAFAHALTKRIKSNKMVEKASFLLSCSLFVDDYLSNLAVGCVMAPLANRFSIARNKLAFLVHSMSGPLVILAPISSWSAMITGSLDSSGISLNNPTNNVMIAADPFMTYLQAIPFILYSLILIASIWFIIECNISFGPMASFEKDAQSFHLTNQALPQTPQCPPFTCSSLSEGSIADLLLPLGTLIMSVFIGILWQGGFWLFGGPYGFLEATRHVTKISFILFTSGFLALTAGTIFALVRSKISANKTPQVMISGIELIFPAILMVFFASTLGAIMRSDLHTGVYLASLLKNGLGLPMLPLLLFVLSSITALVTGSSWGTIALMLPVGMEMLTTLTGVTLPTTPTALPLLYPVLGAIFAGSVAGDHLSPMSETTIMAATSAGCDALEHAHSQFIYAIPVLLSSCLGFALIGLMPTASYLTQFFVSFGTSLSVCLCSLWLLNKLHNR